MQGLRHVVPATGSPDRGRNAVPGLRQYVAPLAAAELLAAVNGRTLSTLNLTAGDGSLLAEVDPDLCLRLGRLDPGTRRIQSKYEIAAWRIPG